MTVFDTDIMTEIFRGTAAIVERAKRIPPEEQGVPIVAVEEILRGRLNAVRQAEAGRIRISITRAYDLLRESLSDFRRLIVLPYTDQAELLFREWREQRIRVATHDLRIAALCVDHGAKLVSRNRRDFDQIPGLTVEYWP
jgi:tRNA(fMet)-specific endonuclease VapC